jgi:hypothetical protein
MGQKVHPLGFRTGTRLKDPSYSSNTWDNYTHRGFFVHGKKEGYTNTVEIGQLFEELAAILDSKG